MKIVNVVPHVLSTPLEESFSFSQGWVDKRSAMKDPMLEYDRSSHPFREGLIGGAISTVNGKAPVPHRPGIGVEVDRTVLERYGKPFR